MKKYLTIAIMVVAACGIVKAGTGLDTLAAESSVAASYGDLDTARTLSGKQIDGSLLKVSDAEAVQIGELVSAQKEDLKMSEPKNITLKTHIPKIKNTIDKAKEHGDLRKIAPILKREEPFSAILSYPVHAFLSCQDKGLGPVVTAASVTGAAILGVVVTPVITVLIGLALLGKCFAIP